MANIIVILIILLILGLSIYRIIIEKRRGSKCVGCPLSGGCSSYSKTTVAKRIMVKEKI